MRRQNILKGRMVLLIKGARVAVLIARRICGEDIEARKGAIWNRHICRMGPTVRQQLGQHMGMGAGFCFPVGVSDGGCDLNTAQG